MERKIYRLNLIWISPFLLPPDIGSGVLRFESYECHPYILNRTTYIVKKIGKKISIWNLHQFPSSKERHFLKYPFYQRYNSYTIKFTLSKCTVECLVYLQEFHIHHHNHIPEHFTPQETPDLLPVTPQSLPSSLTQRPHLPAPGNH